jgi:short-subunit dehydrogenase
MFRVFSTTLKLSVKFGLGKNMQTVANKTVLITGGAMGIGKLFAEKSVQEGAKVVLWDINQNALKATADELRSKGGQVFYYVVDVSDYKSIEQGAQQVLNEVGTVDVLFNNAGIVVGAMFTDHTVEQIEKTIKINTLGPMHVARVFLPGMIEKKAGRLINIASAAGLIANPRMSVYAASKWAVIGWSDSVRLEMEQMGYKNIRVTTVTPSYINTGMFDGVKAPFLTPILQPETIVNAVWEGMKKGKPFVCAPFIVNFVPFLKGLLPARAFDLIAGKWLGVYNSMNQFKGH